MFHQKGVPVKRIANNKKHTGCQAYARTRARKTSRPILCFLVRFVGFEFSGKKVFFPPDPQYAGLRIRRSFDGSLCRTQKPLRQDSRSRRPPERRPFKASFLFSTHSHVASRGSGGGATVAKPARSDAGTVLHTFHTVCAVRSCCLATGGAARYSAAGERLIAGHRPAAFGRVASVGAERDCVLEVLACSLAPWAPRSDLHHRSGQGAF